MLRVVGGYAKEEARRQYQLISAMQFFRHCPECGRRFHIKLVNKKLVKSERTSRPTRVVTNVRGGGFLPRGASAPPLFVVHDEPPIVIDVEEFQYAYKCKHCGHEWPEKHVERQREG